METMGRTSTSSGAGLLDPLPRHTITSCVSSLLLGGVEARPRDIDPIIVYVPKTSFSIAL